MADLSGVVAPTAPSPRTVATVTLGLFRMDSKARSGSSLHKIDWIVTARRKSIQERIERALTIWERWTRTNRSGSSEVSMVFIGTCSR